MILFGVMSNSIGQGVENEFALGEAANTDQVNLASNMMQNVRATYNLYTGAANLINAQT